MGQFRELSDRKSEVLSKKSALEDSSAKLKLEIEQANEQVSYHRASLDWMLFLAHTWLLSNACECCVARLKLTNSMA